MSTVAAPDTEMRTTDSLMQSSGHPVMATRLVITDPPGSPTTLTLHTDDMALAAIVLGPADAIRIASDLLLSARRRYGRAQPEEN